MDILSYLHADLKECKKLSLPFRIYMVRLIMAWHYLCKTPEGPPRLVNGFSILEKRNRTVKSELRGLKYFRYKSYYFSTSESMFTEETNELI